MNPSRRNRPPPRRPRNPRRPPRKSARARRRRARPPASRRKPEMTKAELIEKVLTAASLNRKEAESAVETIFGSIIQSLRDGEKIELRGFGSFRLRSRGARV